jgi:hypothetical protein
MSSSDIHTICQNLFDAGKTPSVALVKAKLTTQIPLPQIISAVKSFKSGMPDTPPAITQPSAEERLAKLEHQVKLQRQEIGLLQEQVSALRVELSLVVNKQ